MIVVAAGNATTSPPSRRLLRRARRRDVLGFGRGDAIGFSTSTCLPAAMASRARRRCSVCGGRRRRCRHPGRRRAARRRRRSAGCRGSAANCWPVQRSREATRDHSLIGVRVDGLVQSSRSPRGENAPAQNRPPRSGVGGLGQRAGQTPEVRVARPRRSGARASGAVGGEALHRDRVVACEDEGVDAVGQREFCREPLGRIQVDQAPDAAGWRRAASADSSIRALPSSSAGSALEPAEGGHPAVADPPDQRQHRGLSAPIQIGTSCAGAGPRFAPTAQ